MFKRINAALIVIIFACLLAYTPAFAESIGNVNDYLDYLTWEQEAELDVEIDNIKQEFGLDTVIVITDNTEGKTSQSFADDFYDYNGYGVGSDASGLLMLINMDKKEVWISTTGKAQNIFTDSRISTILDHVTEYLGDGNYFESCTAFLNDVKNYANAGIPYNQHNVSGGNNSQSGPIGNESYVNITYWDKVMKIMKSPIVYIIALIISIVTTVIISMSSKGTVTVGSRTYEETGSFTLTAARDDFIREHTTRTKIETSSNSGGSSTHVGSSGRSHGGGGRSF